MKWIDYREKLGIGFNDNQKRTAFISKLNVLFDDLHSSILYQRVATRGFAEYFMMVGEIPYQSDYNNIGLVFDSIQQEKNLFTIISKCVAFINTAGNAFTQQFIVESIEFNIRRYLDELSIQYDLVSDDDGIFIFPKGVPDFDDALVSAPLTWLKDYPNAEKAWSNALRAYSEVNADTASRVADDFRKALERFFQEFFQTGDGKALENCKAEYGKYLKDNGVPSEVSNNLETLLQAYTNYMNNYAKHTDKAKINVLEYLMYQTGNIIRLVIMLKQGEAQ